MVKNVSICLLMLTNDNKCLRMLKTDNKLELSSAKLSSLSLDWVELSWVELLMSLAMTVVMQLDLILKYFKTAFKDFKVLTGLGLHHITTSTGGRVGGLSETRNKAISA